MGKSPKALRKQTHSISGTVVEVSLCLALVQTSQSRVVFENFLLV